MPHPTKAGDRRQRAHGGRARPTRPHPGPRKPRRSLPAAGAAWQLGRAAVERHAGWIRAVHSLEMGTIDRRSASRRPSCAESPLRAASSSPEGTAVQVDSLRGRRR